MSLKYHSASLHGHQIFWTGPLDQPIKNYLSTTSFRLSEIFRLTRFCVTRWLEVNVFDPFLTNKIESNILWWSCKVENVLKRVTPSSIHFQLVFIWQTFKTYCSQISGKGFFKINYERNGSNWERSCSVRRSVIVRSWPRVSNYINTHNHIFITKKYLHNNLLQKKTPKIKLV